MSSTGERWVRAHAIVDAALDLDLDGRDALIAMLCSGDSALEDDVRRWLSGCDRAAGDAFESAPASDHEATPERIGRYRIVRKAGEGGMGTVFEGERDDGEFRQRVAIKLMRPVIARRQEFVQRFRSERQILASLAHPHVARMLDGGVTDNGTPYCVLDYVDGAPLIEWCDARRLNSADRIRLFLQVLDAVRHAHSRLVVHRDLKPSNVLVTDAGQAILLDFGLARLLADDPALPPITRPGGAPAALTPEYASPEQFRNEPLGVSTDLYSLGVLLCELLTGLRPFGKLTGWAALESAVTTQDPPYASSLVGHPGLAEIRDTTPDSLRREIKGDLDRIISKAIERDVVQRYQSVEALESDLRNFLEGKPVTASRGGGWYRASKFLRRNKWRVLAATSAMIVFTGFGINAIIQSRRVAESAARAQAERNAAEEVSKLLLGLFEMPFPFDSGGKIRSLKPLLDSAAARIADSSSSIASRRPELLQSLATGYYGLGDFEKATHFAQRALELLEQNHADPETLGDAHLTAAEMLRSAGRDREALPHYDTATENLVRALGPGNVHIARIQVARARALYSLHEPASASAVLDTAFILFRPDSASNELGLANAWETRAELAAERGDLEEAQRDYQTTKRLRIHAVAPAAEIGGTFGDLGRIALRRGDLAAADSLVRRAITIKVAALGPEYPETADEYVLLGQIRLAQGRVREALTLLDRAIADFQKANSTPPWRMEPAQAARATALAALGRK